VFFDCRKQKMLKNQKKEAARNLARRKNNGELNEKSITNKG
jgi:hypothetical protein